MSAMVCSIFGMWQLDALVAGAAGSVMRVRLDGGRVRAIGRVRAVAFQAHNVCGLHQIRIVLRAVDIVAAETAHAVGIHLAGHEIVALHPVLVRRAVGEMSERLLPELVLFQLPVILEILAHLKARPASRNTCPRSDS